MAEGCNLNFLFRNYRDNYFCLFFTNSLKSLNRMSCVFICHNFQMKKKSIVNVVIKAE